MIKNAIWLFILAFLILVAFLPSYTKMQDLRTRNLEYEQQIEMYQDQQQQLLEERWRLENDPEYREKVAREQMRLIRKGEKVLRLVPEE